MGNDPMDHLREFLAQVGDPRVEQRLDQRVRIALRKARRQSRTWLVCCGLIVVGWMLASAGAWTADAPQSGEDRLPGTWYTADLPPQP